MPRFNTVVFDCDSTLTAVEGIEELAAAHRAEVTRLTEAAMRGELPLEAVYGRRLALARPSRAQVDALGRRYVTALVEDAAEVVAALRAAGIVVRIVSGGVLAPVCAVARALGLEDDAVAAVALRFDAAGNYAGFDESSPLARAGGKRELLAAWRGHLPGPVLLVGDGATDLEARPAVDGFVAFAGVVERPTVVAAALAAGDPVVRAPTLAPILAIALGDQAPAAPRHRALYAKGAALLAPPAVAQSAPSAPPRSL